MRGRMTPKKP